MSSLADVRTHLENFLRNPDESVKDIRSHPDILSSLLQKPGADENLILSGSDDEKKILMRRIAGLISIADQIRMTFNDSNYYYGRLKCSRSGKSAPEKNKPSKHCTTSFSCECKASLKLYYATGVFCFNNHSDVCMSRKEPLNIARSNTTTIENLVSPNKRLAVVTNIAADKTNDHSLKISQLQRKVPDILQPIKKKLVNQALSQSRNNVSAPMSCMELINELKKNNLPYKEVYGLNNDITAILYSDPIIAPCDINNIFILTSDVTHGIFDNLCGFKKLGLWCGIDAARHIRPLGNKVHYNICL